MRKKKLTPVKYDKRSACYKPFGNFCRVWSFLQLPTSVPFEIGQLKLRYFTGKAEWTENKAMQFTLNTAKWQRGTP